MRSTLYRDLNLPVPERFNYPFKKNLNNDKATRTREACHYRRQQ